MRVEATMEIRAYAVHEKGAAPIPFSYRADIGAHDVLVKLTHPRSNGRSSNSTPIRSWRGLRRLAACRNTFDLVLSTLNVPFDLNVYLGMLRPDGGSFASSPRRCNRCR